MRCCLLGCRCSSPRAAVSAAAVGKLTLCALMQSNTSIHGRCSSVGFSTFSRNWTKENMDSVDCQCDSVKFKWTLCLTGPCGRAALVFPPKMSWQNEGPCNIGTARVEAMFDLPASLHGPASGADWNHTNRSFVYVDDACVRDTELVLCP